MKLISLSVPLLWVALHSLQTFAGSVGSVTAGESLYLPRSQVVKSAKTVIRTKLGTPGVTLPVFISTSESNFCSE